MKLFRLTPILVLLALEKVHAQTVESGFISQQAMPPSSSMVDPSAQGSRPVVDEAPLSPPQNPDNLSGDNSKEIPVAIPEAESKPPVIPILPDDNFVYNASESRRDPFRPFGLQLYSASPVVGIPNQIPDAPVVPKGPPPRDLEPLEYFEVDKIEVVALIWGVKKPRALVRDPQGGIHTIWLGQRIGPNQGKVISIREGELEVLEYFDQQGKTIEVPRTIALKRPAGGK